MQPVQPTQQIRTYGAPAAPPSARAPLAERDPRWWVVPAVCTPLAVVLAVVERTTVPLPPVWMFGYLVPFGFILASWLLPPLRRHHGLRLGLGIATCLFAFVYSKAITALVFALALVLWIVNGD